MDVAFALLVLCFVQLLYIPLIVLYYSLYVCVPLCVCVCVYVCVFVHSLWEWCSTLIKEVWGECREIHTLM